MSRDRLQLESPPVGARILAHGQAGVRQALLKRAGEEGLRRGRDEAARLLDEAVLVVTRQSEDFRKALARTASELALEIARTLLRSELKRGAHDIERIVRDTLQAAAVGRTPCVVHLNPADHARLVQARFRSGTRLEPDEGVSPGDVHVETALGLFVRDIDLALGSIQQQLGEEFA